jgi:hypothetical protein
MISDLMTIKTATVSREIVTPDGMGGFSTTTTITTLSKCAIYGNPGSTGFSADKYIRQGSHTLATIPSAYTWAVTDKTVAYAGRTFRVNGIPDQVFNSDELVLVQMDVIE